jgi:mono/diheme cytochrome c family protein
MLAARQMLQDNIMTPFKNSLETKTAQYKLALDRFQPIEENRFLAEKQNAYNLPQFIYQKSCAICHGAVGDGHGVEAVNLFIPPADLTKIRTRSKTLLAVLEEGVPGSAMLYFRIYTKDTLYGVIGYLQKYMDIKSYPEEVPVKIGPVEQKAAEAVFISQCSDCHGKSGRVSPKGAALRPPARDMSVWALEPGTSFKIISEGYANTAMKGYRNLSENVRWAMVKLMYGFYEK